MSRYISADAGAVLLLGIFLFLYSINELIAMLIAIAVHELGHLICLALFRTPVYGIRFTVTGPVIQCDMPNRRIQQVITALSGSAAGILLWFIIRRIYPLCAVFSLFLSVVNLFPVMPLDGGRALSAILPTRKQHFALIIGLMTVFAAAVFGLYLLSAGKGPAMLFFACCLLALACQPEQFDVK